MYILLTQITEVNDSDFLNTSENGFEIIHKQEEFKKIVEERRHVEEVKTKVSTLFECRPQNNTDDNVSKAFMDTFCKMFINITSFHLYFCYIKMPISRV